MTVQQTAKTRDSETKRGDGKKSTDLIILVALNRIHRDV